MGPRDCNWVVVAIKKEDKSKMELFCDRGKMFSASTLVLINYNQFLDSSYDTFNSEMLFRLVQSQNRFHELAIKVIKSCQ